MQSGFHVFDTLSAAGIPGLNIFRLNKFIYEGALIGLGLGMVLQARVSLWYHHDLVHIMSKMLHGAVVGSATGLFCFGLGHFMQIWQISPILSRLTSWTLLGLFIVGTTEFVRSHSGIFWPRIISGGIGGFIGGVIFELLMLYQISGPEHLYGLILAGFSISLLVGLYENRVTSFALRVLSGKQEGQIFLLDQNKFTLGYGSQNDFILNGYAEVCNLHAYIYKKDNQVFIENTDATNEVLVNYRQIDQQSMKKGDVIKIGTATLQYYEI
ncbi:MAG: FHA domain-containing protein [SAR324 cluster bacterium]|nr:FHA domain-containing protein [SAR324 cluster bacterium]